MIFTDSDVLARYPAAPITSDTISLYRGFLNHTLLLNRCMECRRWHHPPRAICPTCWSDDIDAEAIEGRGFVALATVLYRGAPGPGVDYVAGHLVVAVELVEQPGLRYTASMLGASPASVRVGMPVSLTWIKRGGAPVPAFRAEGPAPT